MPLSLRQHKSERRILIMQEEGAVLHPSDPRGLVLSGGGPKGIAYAGMLMAMEEKAIGEKSFLQQITHLAGASAGAMTASLIAFGMTYQDIKTLVTQLDIVSLLDTDGISLRAAGDRFQNILELMYMTQIKKLLMLVPVENEEFVSSIREKLECHERMLTAEKLNVCHVEDIVQLTEKIPGQSVPEGLLKLDRAFKAFHQPETHRVANANVEDNAAPLRFSFCDLTSLRNALPEAKKHLVKKLFVSVTNQSKGALISYDEDSYPFESIAEIVQFSGAHPFLFAPRIKTNESFADSGILDNMPSRMLESAGLHPEEIICVKVEAADNFELQVGKARRNAPETVGMLDYVADFAFDNVIGGRVFESRRATENREKIFNNHGNMLYLNSGSLTTTDVYPTAQQKDFAIEMAYAQTLEYLNRRRSKTFEQPLLAMLHLASQRLEDILQQDGCELTHAHATQALNILTHQDVLIQEMLEQRFERVIDYLQKIEDVLTEAGLNDLEKTQALALCIFQIDFRSEGRLENYLACRVLEEIGPQEQTWYQWILELLWAAIEWISKQLQCGDFSEETTAEDTSAKETNAEEMPQEGLPVAVLSPALRALSLFAYHKTAESVVDPTAMTNMKI